MFRLRWSIRPDKGESMRILLLLAAGLMIVAAEPMTWGTIKGFYR